MSRLGVSLHMLHLLGVRGVQRSDSLLRCLELLLLRLRCRCGGVRDLLEVGGIRSLVVSQLRAQAPVVQLPADGAGDQHHSCESDQLGPAQSGDHNVLPGGFSCGTPGVLLASASPNDRMVSSFCCELWVLSIQKLVAPVTSTSRPLSMSLAM